jgi:hypothetical protein
VAVNYLSCSSRSGGSGVRVSARPDIFASEPPRRLASDHRVFLAKVQLVAILVGRGYSILQKRCLGAIRSLSFLVGSLDHSYSLQEPANKFNPTS